VIPRAAKSEIAGVRANALLVRLTTPPVEGAANKALIAILADTCDVPARAISIESGHRARQKVVRLEGVSVDQANRRLGLSGMDG